MLEQANATLLPALALTLTLGLSLSLSRSLAFAFRARFGRFLGLTRWPGASGAGLRGFLAARRFLGGF